MPTEGLMFVESRILDPSKTSDEKFNKFYNEEHLPDVFKMADPAKSQNVAFRYKNINPDSKTVLPYIALYPLKDISLLSDPEGSAKIIEDTRISKTFDNTDVYEHIEFKMRPYELLQRYEGLSDSPQPERKYGHTLVVIGMEPAEGAEGEQDFDDWYRKQHLDMMAMLSHYRRSTRYKRLDGQKPSYLALHEYDCKPEEMPKELRKVVATDWSKKILKDSQIFQRDVFELVQVQGDTKLQL
jgi:hypothetical protein